LELELQDVPEHPFALFNLGMTLADMGNHDRAVDALCRSILVAAPNESHIRKAYALLVSSLTELHRHEAAREACRKGRSVFPDDAELLFRDGILYQQTGEFDKAEKAYAAVLNTTDERYFASMDHAIKGFKARHNLATVLTSMGRFEDAEFEWRKVTEEVPHYVPGWLGLTDALVRQAKKDGIINEVNRIPDVPDVQPVRIVMLAAAANCRGETQKAIDLLWEGVATFPDDLLILNHTCQLLFEHGNPVDAETALLRLIQRVPDDAAAHHNLGTVYVRVAHFRAAADSFRNSIRLRPESANTWLQLAHVHRKLCDHTAALEAAQQALRFAPNEPKVRRMMEELELAASASP
jgi:tetratricopeptide (TPR) repeat protein